MSKNDRLGTGHCDMHWPNEETESTKVSAWVFVRCISLGTHNFLMTFERVVSAENGKGQHFTVRVNGKWESDSS